MWENNLFLIKGKINFLWGKKKPLFVNFFKVIFRFLSCIFQFSKLKPLFPILSEALGINNSFLLKHCPNGFPQKYFSSSWTFRLVLFYFPYAFLCFQKLKSIWWLNSRCSPLFLINQFHIFNYLLYTDNLSLNSKITEKGT